MKINVACIGLGYVGLITSSAIANENINVVGVDIDENKIRALQAGKSPIYEPGLEQLIKRKTEIGKLQFEQNLGKQYFDAIIVCVGTPSYEDGDFNASQVIDAAASIGEYLLNTEADPLVLLRSTTIPGTTKEIFLTTACEHAKRENIRCAFLPEFLREGSALEDFYSPSRFLIGYDGSQTDLNLVSKIFDEVDKTLNILPTNDAELVKYLDNTFHALKVVFANEVGRLCETLKIDSARIMEEFTQDTKLNISAKYLKPGNPYGGSCLPKDVDALNKLIKKYPIKLPIIENIKISNNVHFEHLNLPIKNLITHSTKSVLFIGLSFKRNTDDIRNSPAIQLYTSLKKDYPDINYFFIDDNVQDCSVPISRHTGQYVDIAIDFSIISFERSDIDCGYFHVY